MYGYMGKHLIVNLSEKKVEQRPLEEEIIRKYLGGMGVNLKLMYDNYHPCTDEFSPDNPIIMGSGPLANTLAPGDVSSPSTPCSTP
jgi:aldehyde:ferredoxin oxidoreductase